MPKRNTWSKDEIQRIAQTDDLHVAPFRDDGATYGTPTWIWAVDGSINDRIDEAYRVKYRDSEYLSPMIGPRARSATVKSCRGRPKRRDMMPDQPPRAQSPFGDIAPALAKITDDVLFGDVWERPGLSPRDRSLITVASLIALYRTNELPFHLKRALENGVTKDELAEVITHLAFYAGWPAASTAIGIARSVFAQTGS
jgi:4-carboxymuconolactone decarboxylase